MNQSKAISAFIRVVAVAMALTGLVTKESSARPAAPFQSALIIPVPNLMGYWSFDSATGTTVTDLSGNNNPGTLTGGATIDAVNRAPIPTGNAGSLGLSGTGQLLSVGDSSSLSITGALTVAAWIRPTAAPGGTQHGIIEKWDDPNVSNGYMLRLFSSNDQAFGICPPAGGVQMIQTTGRPVVPSSGTWTHVAGVFQPAPSPQMVQYRDAVQDALTSASAGYSIEPVTAPGNGSFGLNIGVDHGSNQFIGNIDEVRIYNRALTQPEVQILHDGQPAPLSLMATGMAGFNRLTWSPPPTPASGVTYSVLSGPSTGNYTAVVVNGLTTTTYDDLSAPPGVPTYYVVVAVTVMASGYSNEASGTATPAGPPPPPPAPRTTKSPDHGRCGCSTILAVNVPSLLSGGALILAALLALPRRRRNKA